MKDVKTFEPLEGVHWMSLRWETRILFLRGAPIARAIVFPQLLRREGMFDQGTTKDHSFLPLGKEKKKEFLKGLLSPWEQTTTTLNPNVS